MDELIEKIKSNIFRLPIKQAHQEIAPYRKNTPDSLNYDKEIKYAAVLLLLFPFKSELSTIFIHRANYKGVHSDQIGLPGGQYEIKDDNMGQTALRETEEELGIPSKKIHLIEKLSDIYIPPSNFEVKPYIGFINELSEIKLDKREVSGYFIVPLKELLKPDTIKTRQVMPSDSHLKMKVPCFVYKEKIIWGATAMIINEFRYLLSFDRQSH